MIAVESPETFPIFLPMLVDLDPSFLFARLSRPRANTPRAKSLSDLPVDLAFFFSCASVASSMLRTRISTDGLVML